MKELKGEIFIHIHVDSAVSWNSGKVYPEVGEPYVTGGVISNILDLIAGCETSRGVLEAPDHAPPHLIHGLRV